ncbi:MAG TPA: FlgD immunoglobulin-like domain containing protein [Bacteroidota bacterium]|nr:FlgD immunoglobulin-like domain containing protein [Bacteroidota bacterium]
MKTTHSIMAGLAFAAVLFVSTPMVGQTAGDYRSSASGNWNAAATWQMFDGAVWNAASVPPSGTSGTITIQSGNTVTVAASAPDTINGAALVVNGYLLDSSNVAIVSGSMTVNNGGSYEMAHASASGKGIPTATWNTGSTCLLTGITSSTTGINASQNFYNLVVNSPGWSGNLNLGWNSGSVTIAGNITVKSTGASGRWQMCAPTAGTAGAHNTVAVNIDGNLVVDGSATNASNKIQFTSNGTSNNYNDITINVLGNTTVTGNAADNTFVNFAAARGSQGGTGTSVWNLHGDLMVTNATVQNSNAAGARFNFVKQGVQELKLSNVSFAGGGLPIEVSSGATLDLDTNVVAGSGLFTADSGATIVSKLATGLNGNLTNSGTISLSKQGNYSYTGSVGQFTGALLPDTIGTLTVASTDTLWLSDSLTATQVVVPAGGILDINQNVHAKDMNVTGTVIAADTLMVSDTALFNSGSIYNHAINGGKIPTGKWNSGSTLMLTGIAGNSPSNGNQNFYNVVWNCPNQAANLNLGWNGITIGGNITVINTGGSRWQFCAPAVDSTTTVTINGDVVVSGGALSANGTSNGNTTIIINQLGNVNVSGGNFSVSRGSQGGTGSTTWNLNGDFIMSNATTQNSNTANARFFFVKQGTQLLKLSNVTFAGGGLPIEVTHGTTLDLDTSVVAGNGLFMADSGATLITRLPGGLGANLTTTGAITLNPKTNYIYGGKLPQITGSLLPDTLTNLTINDSSGVTLSKKTRINGILTLKAGVFNNAIPFTLGLGGSVSYQGGSLLLPAVLNWVTIGEARKDLNNDSIPDHLVTGDTLMVTGVITSPNLSGTTTTFFIQDSTGGIEVFHSGLPPVTYAMGDSVFAIGKVAQFHGLDEMSLLALDTLHFGILKHHAAAPKAKHVTLHQYITNAEAYEGQLIEIDTLFKASGTWGSGQNVEVTNATKKDSTAIYINAATTVASSSEPIYPINVVAIASQFASTGVTGGYEIIPRDTSDVVHITVTGVKDPFSDIPTTFVLENNYPNPFNPSTTILYGVASQSHVTVKIYSVLGQEVSTLVNDVQNPSYYRVVWNGKDYNGNLVSSGVYFFRIIAQPTDGKSQPFMQVKKMMLMK